MGQLYLPSTPIVFLQYVNYRVGCNGCWSIIHHLKSSSQFDSQNSSLDEVQLKSNLVPEFLFEQDMAGVSSEEPEKLYSSHKAARTREPQKEMLQHGTRLLTPRTITGFVEDSCIGNNS